MVSFKSASSAVAAPDTETAPAAEETPLPFPSFLSGDKSMPAPPQDPEPDAASQDDAPVPKEETPPTPMITIDIMSMLSKMSLEAVSAREAALSPLMDKIRAELDRTA